MLLVDDDQPEVARPARRPPSAARRTIARLAARAAAATRRSARPPPARSAARATVSPKRAAKRATVCGVERDLRHEHDHALARARAPRRPPAGRPRSCREPVTPCSSSARRAPASIAASARRPARASASTVAVAAPTVRARGARRLRARRDRHQPARLEPPQRRQVARPAGAGQPLRAARAGSSVSRSPSSAVGRARRPQRRLARARGGGSTSASARAGVEQYSLGDPQREVDEVAPGARRRARRSARRASRRARSVVVGQLDDDAVSVCAPNGIAHAASRPRRRRRDAVVERAAHTRRAVVSGSTRAIGDGLATIPARSAEIVLGTRRRGRRGYCLAPGTLGHLRPLVARST